MKLIPHTNSGPDRKRHLSGSVPPKTRQAGDAPLSQQHGKLTCPAVPCGDRRWIGNDGCASVPAPWVSRSSARPAKPLSRESAQQAPVFPDWRATPSTKTQTRDALAGYGVSRTATVASRLTRGVGGSAGDGDLARVCARSLVTGDGGERPAPNSLSLASLHRSETRPARSPVQPNSGRPVMLEGGV